MNTARDPENRRGSFILQLLLVIGLYCISLVNVFKTLELGKALFASGISLTFLAIMCLLYPYSQRGDRW